MSSWKNRSYTKRPTTDILRTKSPRPATIYDNIKNVHLLDTFNIYKSDMSEEMRVFNCAILVKKANGDFTYTLNDIGDNILFMFRQTPMVEPILNSISFTNVSWLNFTISSPVSCLMKDAARGDKEDARFFIFKNQLGISYSEKGSMGLSWVVKNTLQPIDLDFSNFPNEKNWVFFEKDAELYAMRFYNPLEIYKVDLENKEFTKVFSWGWEYPIEHQLRGGSPPVLYNNKYYVFLHSAVTYKSYVLVLDPDSFSPLEFSESPLLENIPSTKQFICGAVCDKINNRWLLSLGLDDTYCCVAKIKFEDLQAKLVRVKGVEQQPV